MERLSAWGVTLLLALVTGCSIIGPREVILLSKAEDSSAELVVARIPHPPDYDLEVKFRPREGWAKRLYFMRDGYPSRAFAVRFPDAVFVAVCESFEGNVVLKYDRQRGEFDATAAALAEARKRIPKPSGGSSSGFHSCSKPRLGIGERP